MRKTTSAPCAGEAGLREEQFLNDFITRQTSLKYVILNTYFPDFDANGRWLNRDPAFPNSHLTHYGDPASKQRTSFQNYFEGLSRRIAFLEERGLAVILFLPKPELGHNVRECITRPLPPDKARTCRVEAQAALEAQRMCVWAWQMLSPGTRQS